MKLEAGENQFTVTLSRNEVFKVQGGGIVGERGGFLIDSKIEVAPLSDIQEDETTKHRFAHDRLARGLEAPLVGHLMGNGDLRIHIPDVTLRDASITERTLTLDEIKVITGPEEMIQIIPEKGVRILFGGSLQIINVS